MRKTLYAACGAAWLVAGLANVALAHDTDRVIDRDAVKHFATLPNGVRYPEGITADPDSGEVYVGTFDFGPNTNKLLRFSRHGRLLAQIDFNGAPLLGLEFDRRHDKVYIANFGAQQIQRVDAKFQAKTPVEIVANMPAIGPPGPRTEGNPDGSQDTITFGAGRSRPTRWPSTARGISTYRTRSRARSSASTTRRTARRRACRCRDPRSAARHRGVPAVRRERPRAERDETTLFVANTGDDRVLKLDLAPKL